MSPRENIEDSIMSDIEANTGDDFGSGSTDNDNGADNGQGNSSAEPTHSADPSNNKGRQDNGNQSQRGDRGDTRGQRDKANEKGKQKDPKDQQPRRNERGDIVDERGQVIASRGVERRLHLQNERLKQQTTSLNNEINQLRQQVQNNSVLNSMPSQFGLSNEDVPEALRIAGVMKKDPVGGARMALEYALSQGADLNQIVTAQNLQNISLGAQRRMMEEFNRPQQMQRQAEQQRQQAQQSALRFRNNHPEAEEHLDDIAKMVPEIIRRGQTEGRQIDPYTAGEMALRTLQNWAMQKGLDPNRRIQDQIDELQEQQARNGGQQQQNRDVRTNSPRQQQPMPNGSRGNRMAPSRSGSLPASASNDAIVRQAMADAGYRFDT